MASSTPSNMMKSRVSVFRKGSESPIDFHSCLIKVLESESDSVNVSVQLKDQRLYIEPQKEGLILKHPSFCPMLHTDKSATNLDRNIDVGVCGLLESKDEYILITRRSKSLRTFPGSWVPPGGVIDLEDDSLLTTCLRELAEETGLTDLKLESASSLCCWESVYPYSYSMGPPRRHHLVIYYTLKSSHSKEKLENQLNLQEEEVDAVAWLSPSFVRDLTCSKTSSESEGLIDIISLVKENDLSKTLKITKISSSVFFNNVPSKSCVLDCERITTGTLFAMSQWVLTKFPSAVTMY
ncbi:nucleoside diphosphate-linked moiety X motif 17 [Lepeophtheirus salmonis]|uniref:m7GpppN-mRNA hydrolase NUDT17 n=1 Tax=Lepeophtheirus salmonis TaxID=72036 RepID=D3PGE1_LEPSM|nr:nucleoside diphosphate-linked moiety X motif 17-like [Lepeophtheirus salmonis]XP_040577021.1 nucleoside diphosphate-linked moiety X motif 17-like [Lepeophtheirus salmonis]ADD24337.1 Nucleoside diphosphate-linked moiety X motif 17 [Lepeophtheirus salmonis]